MSFLRPATTTIDLTGIERVPIRFKVAPHADILSLTVDAIGLRPLGGPPAQRAAIRGALRAGRGGLVSLMHPEVSGWWDGLAPVAMASRQAYHDFGGIDRDGAVFRDTMDHEYGNRMPPPLRRIVARPGPFFDSYVKDCAAVWEVFGPRIGDPLPILEREAERIGSAAVRGALPELLSTVLPPTTLRGNSLFLPNMSRANQLTIAPDGLTIGISLNGLRWASFSSKPGTTQLNAVWYPAPIPVFGRPPQDALVALLGTPRAGLLRHLDQAVPAGHLAEGLRTTPSGVTHHVDALVAGGLVQRRREGRRIMVSRTSRGDRLLDLYGG